MMKLNLKSINFKQPKYVLPAILYPLIILVGYFVIDIFNFTAPERDNGMETTEYLNASLPSPSIKGSGIGGKMSNMQKEWGNVTDFTAIDNLAADSVVQYQEYESKYSDEDLAMLAAAQAEHDADMDRLKRLHEELLRQEEEAAANEAEFMGRSATETRNPDPQAQMEELQAALMAAVNRLPADEFDTAPESSGSTSRTDEQQRNQTETSSQTQAVHELAEDAVTETVVKKEPAKSDYFNTLTDNDREPKLIKAIIDENIKATDGSRVRLRLLDDIELDGVVLSKGTCIYAIMSGFGSQRVNGRVQSILVGDELRKVSLTLYDTDGMEGLYVPKSQFEETTKDVASQALNGSSMMSTSNGYNNSMERWGMQALQGAISRTTQAFSKNIRKNRANLKYGTFVYLVNGRQR